MRRWPALALALLAAPAAAETWVWTDGTGADHYTDDPSMVPEAARRTLRSLDGEGTLSVVETDGAADPEAAAAERQRLLLEQRAQRERETRRAELQAAVESLRRQLSEADRDVRKYEAGGRIGAAEAAARARELAKELRARLAAKERELAAAVPPAGE